MAERAWKLFNQVRGGSSNQWRNAWHADGRGEKTVIIQIQLTLTDTA